ncbi:MAG: ATPase [Flammeovirgaceae bacterium]
MADSQMTIACITSYHKGMEFMRACKRMGAKVIFITAEKLRDKNWPWESIDETFYIPGDQQHWKMDDVIRGLAHTLRHQKIDKMVALDDFDVEKVAHLREEFRIPGMGQTQARYFRDKLAMRKKASESGIPVPEFTDVFNDEVVNEFVKKVPAPWVLKPRSSASAIGIKKIESAKQLWEVFQKVGDERHEYVLERFLPGDVFHVDSLVYDGKIIFARAHQYMNPPMEVAHEGRVFRSYTMEYGSDDEVQLQEINKNLLKAFGMEMGASHTEFIKHNGKYYFLETSARVGGANIVEMVEASSGINLWAEWAKMEIMGGGGVYKLPKVKKDYAGIIVSLAKQQKPDTSAYNDPEIYWRKQDMDFHAGLIVSSKKLERVKELLDNYAKRFYQDFFITVPLAEKPSN